MQTEVTTIPRRVQIFYTTYAAFPTTNLRIGDLAYATDLYSLYRWNGTAWQVISAPGSKEFLTRPNAGTENATDDRWGGYRLDALNESAYLGFYVPADFASIDEAVVIRKALATATHGIAYYSSYSAVGEIDTTHQEATAIIDTDETDNFIYEQDISGILTAIAPGDYVGIWCYSQNPNPNVPNDLIIGLRFKYL